MCEDSISCSSGFTPWICSTCREAVTFLSKLSSNKHFRVNNRPIINTAGFCFFPFLFGVLSTTLKCHVKQASSCKFSFTLEWEDLWHELQAMLVWQRDPPSSPPHRPVNLGPCMLPDASIWWTLDSEGLSSSAAIKIRLLERYYVCGIRSGAESHLYCDSLATVDTRGVLRWKRSWNRTAGWVCSERSPVVFSPSIKGRSILQALTPCLRESRRLKVNLPHVECKMSFFKQHLYRGGRKRMLPPSFIVWKWA